MRLFSTAVVAVLVGAGQAAAADAPTFYKDVLPVLQANCQTCHRPGEVAPMSLLTYEQARPWAKAIKTAVASKKMPPWFADPAYGHFSNERRLSAPRDRAAERVGRRRRARPATRRTRRRRSSSRTAGTSSPTSSSRCRSRSSCRRAARSTTSTCVVKTNFKEDMWVIAAEMRPGNPPVLHHGKVWVRPPGSKWMEKAVAGEAYESESHRDILGRNAIEEGNDILGKFNPGLGAQRFDMEGAAKFVPKGSDLVFELHYTTSGQPTTDVSKLGLVLAKEPPRTRYFFNAGPTAFNLAIPPGDGNAEVVSEITFGENARLVYAQPHMHLRGKDFELRVVTPDKQMHDRAQGRLELRLADGLPVRRVDCAAQGLEAAADLALRQLARQPVQPRSRPSRSCGDPRTGTR